MAWHGPGWSVPCRAPPHHTPPPPHTRDHTHASPPHTTPLRPRAPTSAALRVCAHVNGLHITRLRLYACLTSGGDLAHGLTSGDRADDMAGWKPAPHLRPWPPSRRSDRASAPVWSQLSGCTCPSGPAASVRRTHAGPPHHASAAVRMPHLRRRPRTRPHLWRSCRRYGELEACPTPTATASISRK